MKKLSYLFCVAALGLLSGCKTYEPAPEPYPHHHFNHYILDLKPLTNDGFFITESGSVSFNYQPLGVLEVEEESGTKEYRVKNFSKPKKEKNKEKHGKVEKPKRADDDLYYKEPGEKKVKETVNQEDDLKNLDWISASTYTALEELVRIAKEEGADGIIGLRIQKDHSSVFVSGTMIKRK